MGFNQGPAVGLRAWHGTAMMAHFKDVGLGRGQAWVALLERVWRPEQTERKERESAARSTQQKLATDPLKACKGCINESGLCVEWCVFMVDADSNTHIHKV